MAAGVRALRYFVDTGDIVLHYDRDSEAELVGFTDSRLGQ